MTYDQFLERKIKRIEDAGFEPKEVNPLLFDFQDHRYWLEYFGLEVKRSRENVPLHEFEKALAFLKKHVNG